MPAIRSSRVLLPDGALCPATVHFAAGRITRVDPAPDPQALDLGDAVLMPALLDSHVHINEPGRTAWEGFVTATQAAAAGGIATVVDMPLNSDPVTTTVEALHQKIEASIEKCWVDVGFWGGVVPGNASELAPMIRAGVLGFKCFTCHSGIDDFPASTPDDLRIAMPVLREAGLPLLVHAELESELAPAAADLDARQYLRYLHSRPKAWEDRAVAMMIDLVRETGCAVHIVHLSSATALPLIRRAKAEGLPLTVETCPHYLCLSAEQVPDGATEFKCAPPIREDENRAALWAALADGTIDTVISDHSPCIPSLKLPERGDFLEAWGGIASLQLGLPNVWTEARRRGHGIGELVRWMSRGPAQWLGLEDRGAIHPGKRADLVAWHPEREWTISAEDLLHRHRISPYIGRRVCGEVIGTWVRGQRVWDQGRPSETPYGQLWLRGQPGGNG